MKAFYENQYVYNTIPLSAAVLSDLTFLPHWHVEVEMILVLEGSIEMGVNTERRLLYPGDIAIAFSNDIHSYVTSDKSAVILVKFLPEFLDGTGMWQKNHRLRYPFIPRGSNAVTPVSETIHQELTGLLKGLYEEHEQQEEYYTWMIRGKLLELCAICLRHLPKKPSSEEDLLYEQGASGIQIVRAALQYMGENIAHNVSLVEIAKKMSVSPYYFSRIFNKVTGMSLKGYQNSLRLNKAEELILNDLMPITEIAYGCGFNSLRTFNRWFRLMKGCTPSELRKLQQDALRKNCP